VFLTDRYLNEEMTMTVRCKFKCVAAGQREGWGTAKVLYHATLQPVTSGSEENKEFFEATPSGKFEVDTVKTQPFEVGKEYFIDVSPVS
jgi:hypothetical protein